MHLTNCIVLISQSCHEETNIASKPNPLSMPLLPDSNRIIMTLNLRERLRPDEHTLVPRRRIHELGHGRLGARLPPQVRPGVEVVRQAFTFGLAVVDLGNVDDLLLDVGEGVVGVVGDTVLEAVFLEREAAASEQRVGVFGGGEVADAVADEDDHWDGAVFALQLQGFFVLRDGDVFIVTRRRLVLPDRFPGVAFRVDLGVVGDNVDVGGGFLADEIVEYPLEDGLQTGGDDVEGDLIVQAEVVEGLEILVQLHVFRDCLQSVVEGDVEGTPQVI